MNWPDVGLLSLELEGLNPKLSPPPCLLMWPGHCVPPSQWDNAVSSVMGVLHAKKMQCGRAGMDGLPEKPPGALGGRARDAVTPGLHA